MLSSSLQSRTVIAVSSAAAAPLSLSLSLTHTHTMNSNATSTLQPTDSRRKRKVEPIFFTKKLRSKIPRRKRFQISPILTESSNSLLSNDKHPEFSAIQAASSSSSCFPGEISSLSTWISVGSESNNKKRRSTREKKKFEDVHGFEVAFRPITRLYLKQKECERDLGVELSESSCVESTSGVATGVLITSESNLKNEEQIEVTAASDAVSLSEVSCVQHATAPIVSEQSEFDEKTSKLKDRENEASTTFLLEKDEALDASVSVFSEEANRAPELSFTEISRNNLEEATSFEYSLDQKPKELELQEYSLACSEELSYGDNSEYTSELEIESEIFPRSCSIELSDYSPSMFIDSLEESSQDSDQNSPPPIYFPFYLRYQKHFTKLNSSTTIEASAQVQDDFNDEFTLLRFENEEYEQSYRKFRSREKKLVLHDYTEDYSSTTEFGELVLQQRLLMVNWIVEQSTALELQVETMFLGVSLLDRFLSKGFFKHKRKLQVLGIACLALATRLEENQPYNCVRQSAFYVGKNVYSRFEVIGMEWLVQEVLNFQCFLPTIHNFLWFYLKAAKANAEVEKRTKYLAVLSLLDHERLWYWPSTVAAGLVILASLAANQESSCQWVMETHVRTKDDDLPECIQSLEWLVKYVS